MLKRGIESVFYLKILIVLCVLLLDSCIDEPFINRCDDTIISIWINPDSGSGTRAFVDDDLEEKEGEYPDNIVRNLRIMTFESGGGQLLGNEHYDVINSALDVINHPVQPGTYDFVFLANIPDGFNLPAITQFSDLNSIAYPESAFTSDKLIPMLQVIKGVNISSTGVAKLTSGTLKDINGNERTEDVTQGLYGVDAETSLLILRLDRLAARIEIVLKSTIDLEGLFTGITFSNIPDVVPLFSSAYSSTITRDTERAFTLVDDATHFSDALTPEMEVEGYVWATKITRIILPSNNLNLTDFTDKTAKASAVVLTANVDNKYNPSAPLSIMGDADTPYNYTIPYNTYLDIDGIVNEPLELNIAASTWIPVDEDWQIAEIRMLNVSHTEVNITDFNGARISFWSNMPSVRVLPEVYLVNGDVETEDVTNLVFNDLAMTVHNNNEPTRFYYNHTTGSGYMDILVDSLNVADANWEYKLYLVAENNDGTNQLKREITVNVEQYGTRYRFSPYISNANSAYSGAFFRNSQKGERIITGQSVANLSTYTWTATTSDDWIVLSSTPSFDPHVGTNDPGDPENYTVRPNTTKYKGDAADGSSITGRGRVYFRVGLTDESGVNRYGTISLKLNLSSGWAPIQTIYIRQGEEADYIFTPQETVTINIGNDETDAVLREGARKFSPYNLTADNLEASSATGYVGLSIRTDNSGGGVFVGYPTQAGAFFQWSGGASDYYRRAYHPLQSAPADSWNSVISLNFWDTEKAENETCPPGYSRPNDGSEIRQIFSGLYYDETSSNYKILDKDSLNYSTFRMSLFQSPQAGDGFRSPSGTMNTTVRKDIYPSYPASQYEQATSVYLWDPVSETGSGGPIGHTQALSGTVGGFYADGFFDRRPIDYSFKGVSTNNADVAYNGVLFFNGAKSVFFPATGRLNSSGTIQSRGSTGYYWSSSGGPSRTTHPRPAWCFELAYYYISPVTTLRSFGSAIRCVEGDSSEY